MAELTIETEVQDGHEVIVGPSSPQYKRRRRSRAPPKDLASYAQSKGYFSVSELVGPTWCEFAYNYGVLGLSFLPVAERPTEVTLPSGLVIKPDQAVAVRREEVQIRGREVHEKLEREIHPLQVYVQTKTREDDWALRLLRLVVGLRSLLDGGCVRELPILGYVQDHVVFGIIDEIERRPIRRTGAHPSKPKSATSESPSKTVPSDQAQLPFSTEAPRSIAYSGPKDVGPSTPSRSGGKVWASQDEWKAHQRKKADLKKAASKSKPKTKISKGASPSEASKSSRSDDIDLSQGSAIKTPPFDSKVGSPKRKTPQKGLLSYFSQPSQPKEPADARPATPANAESSATVQRRVTPQQQSRPHGFFLSDTKTRIFPVIPDLPDQKAARLQTMLYKRFFDGLCKGALQRQQDILQPEDAARGQNDVVDLSLDPDAIPFEHSALFRSLDLDPSAGLSEVFVDDAQQLLDGTDFAVTTPGGELSRGRESLNQMTLTSVTHLVDRTLLQVIAKARADAKPLAEIDGQPMPTAIIQDSLSLTYRVQSRRGQWKKHRSRGSHQAQRTHGARRGQKEQSHLLSNDAGSNSREKHLVDDENRELQLAIQLSLEGQADSFGGFNGAGSHSSSGGPSDPILVSSPPRRRSTRLRQNVEAKTAAVAEKTSPSVALTPSAPSSGSFQPSTPPAKKHSSPELEQSSQPKSPPSRLIGRVSFQHSPPLLAAHLTSILSLWAGTRPLTGVSESETWKCKGCEWRDGCEWRATKGEERWREAMIKVEESRRKAEEEQTAVSGADAESGGDDSDSQAGRDVGAESDLWRQFGTKQVDSTSAARAHIRKYDDQNDAKQQKNEEEALLAMMDAFESAEQ
ncbi:unnamed protein product [Jaminaea pallidilutea]